MIIEKMETRSLVRKGSVTLFSWGEASLNPYQGCYHNCSYCDGYSEGYYMHEDFSEWSLYLVVSVFLHPLDLNL